MEIIKFKKIKGIKKSKKKKNNAQFSLMSMESFIKNLYQKRLLLYRSFTKVIQAMKKKKPVENKIMDSPLYYSGESII